MDQNSPQPPRRSLLGGITGVKVFAFIGGAVGFIASLQQLFGGLSKFVTIGIVVLGVAVVVAGAILITREWGKPLRWPAVLAIVVTITGAMIFASSLTVLAPGVMEQAKAMTGMSDDPHFLGASGEIDLDPEDEYSGADLTLNSYYSYRELAVPTDSGAVLALADKPTLEACNSATWQRSLKDTRPGSHLCIRTDKQRLMLIKIVSISDTATTFTVASSRPAR